MTDSEARESAALRDAYEALNHGKFGDYGAAFSQHAEVRYPQSGERIVGRDRIVAACQANPTPPQLNITNIEVSGDLAVVEADEVYEGGDVWKSTSIYEFTDGVIARATCYFGQPFEAASWRQPFIE